MVQIPSWEANWFEASQEISRNPKVNYRNHKRPHLPLSWASLIQSTCQHPTSWRSTIILIIHLLFGLPSGLLPSSFPTKTLYKNLSSPIHTTCTNHLIRPNFITNTYFVNSTNYSILLFTHMRPYKRPSVKGFTRAVERFEIDVMLCCAFGTVGLNTWFENVRFYQSFICSQSDAPVSCLKNQCYNIH